MATKRTTQTRTSTKNDTKEDVSFVGVFTMNETKNGGFVANPKIDPKYGIKAIIVVKNDGSELELGKDDPIFFKQMTGRGANGSYSFYSGSIIE